MNASDDRAIKTRFRTNALFDGVSGEEKIEHGRAKSEDGVWKALLVRGEDRHRNWGHNHPPFPFSKGVFKRSLPKPDL